MELVAQNDLEAIDNKVSSAVNERQRAEGLCREAERMKAQLEEWRTRSEQQQAHLQREAESHAVITMRTSGFYGDTIAFEQQQLAEDLEKTGAKELERAAAAVKKANANLAAIHEKTREVQRQHHTAEYRERQRARLVKEAAEARQKVQVKRQVEDETKQKLNALDVSEAMKATRLRHTTSNRLTKDAEQMKAEEKEQAAERMRQQVYAKRWQEQKMQERREKEERERKEREAIEEMRKREREENITAQREAERRAREQRDAAMARKREELVRKRQQERADKEREEAEIKERFGKIEQQRLEKEKVRIEMEKQAAKALAEAKAVAAANAQMQEEQAAAAKNEAGKRAKIRQEREKKEAEAAIVRVKRSEKLTKKQLKTSKQLEAEYEQACLRREEESKAKQLREVEAQREVDAQRRHEEHLAELRAIKRHKTQQASEVREKLTREALDAATKKALAEQTRARQAAQQEEKRQQNQQRWKEHYERKASEHAELLARTKARAKMEADQRRTSDCANVNVMLEANGTHSEKAMGEKQALEASRSAFRKKFRDVGNQSEMAKRMTTLHVERSAARLARANAQSALDALERAVHLEVQRTTKDQGQHMISIKMAGEREGSPTMGGSADRHKGNHLTADHSGKGEAPDSGVAGSATQEREAAAKALQARVRGMQTRKLHAAQAGKHSKPSESRGLFKRFKDIMAMYQSTRRSASHAGLASNRSFASETTTVAGSARALSGKVAQVAPERVPRLPKSRLVTAASQPTEVSHGFINVAEILEAGVNVAERLGNYDFDGDGDIGVSGSNYGPRAGDTDTGDTKGPELSLRACDADTGDIKGPELSSTEALAQAVEMQAKVEKEREKARVMAEEGREKARVMAEEGRERARVMAEEGREKARAKAEARAKVKAEAKAEVEAKLKVEAEAEAKAKAASLIVRKTLKVRAGSELDSAEAGELTAGTRVIVVERQTLSDGTHRACLARFHGGGAGGGGSDTDTIGWVSSISKSDGLETLLPPDDPAAITILRKPTHGGAYRL